MKIWIGEMPNIVKTFVQRKKFGQIQHKLL